MLGTWTGSGWMMLGPGQRAEFNQTETVKKKLDGTLITIDGDGRDKSNAPYGKTRFTLDFTDGKWHEIGEFSRDGGQNWMKNFEMTLSRAK